MMQSVEEINRVLAGFSDVQELAISFEPAFGTYSLKLVLAGASEHTITLQFGEIRDLRLIEFGGGLTQILGLRAYDVRARQFDRIVYHFTDCEREQIAFDCRT